MKTLQIVQSFEKKNFLLWPLLTSCDKPFSTVFCSMYSSSFPNYSTSTRPHRISRLTFLFYSLNLLHKVTYILWALTCCVALPSYTAFVLSFCSSSQDFDTHFLHVSPHGGTLVLLYVVGDIYLHYGLSPISQTTCLSYTKKTWNIHFSSLLILLILMKSYLI